jgi:hypothetical protein
VILGQIGLEECDPERASLKYSTIFGLAYTTTAPYLTGEFLAILIKDSSKLDDFCSAI